MNIQNLNKSMMAQVPGIPQKIGCCEQDVITVAQIILRLWRNEGLWREDDISSWFLKILLWKFGDFKHGTSSDVYRPIPGETLLLRQTLMAIA